MSLNPIDNLFYRIPKLGLQLLLTQYLLHDMFEESE